MSLDHNYDIHSLLPAFQSHKDNAVDASADTVDQNINVAHLIQKSAANFHADSSIRSKIVSSSLSKAA